MQNKQLQTRVLTALVFGPLFLTAIFLPKPFWFSLIMGLLLLYGSWEYSQLCKFRSASLRNVFVMLHALLIATGLALLWNTGVSGFDIRFYYFVIAVALTALWGFSRFAAAGEAQSSVSWTIISAIQGLVLITGAWLALSWLRFQPQGSWLILQLLLIIWVADIAAYFTGRAFGKRKLAPKISPGKTWAGVTGAMVFAPLAALACARFSPLPEIGAITTVLLALVTVSASIGGDLFISLLKRAAGVKDSGKLLPGHGGILDRFDSLITGSVFFVLGLLFLIEHSG